MQNQIKIVNILIGIFNGVANTRRAVSPVTSIDNMVLDNILSGLREYISNNPTAPTDDRGFVAWKMAPELLETVLALKSQDAAQVHECARILQVRMAGSSVISEALRNDLLEARRISRAELNPIPGLEAM